MTWDTGEYSQWILTQGDLFTKDFTADEIIFGSLSKTYFSLLLPNIEKVKLKAIAKSVRYHVANASESEKELNFRDSNQEKKQRTDTKLKQKN